MRKRKVRMKMRTASERPLVTVFLVTVGVLCASRCLTASARASQTAKSDTQLRALHEIGKVVARAVLDKDTATLLRYDRADLRAEDESSLKNTKSDLYCFLFDSSCISGKGRSVLDKLSSSRQLAIKVVDGGKSKIDGRRYATLLFYD